MHPPRAGSRAWKAAQLPAMALAIVPMILASVFLPRYWQSGLAAGSVKR